jgi:hypothetical protein
MHGDLSIFEDGFTALERRFLKSELINMTKGATSIGDVDMQGISKPVLHKVSDKDEQTAYFWCYI